MESTRKMLPILAVAGLGLLIVRSISRASTVVTVPISTFFQPEAVAQLAASFPSDTEENFVLSAWQYVGELIPYEPIGSDLYFSGNQVTCEECFLGADAISRKRGNCVSKSSLLVSILLNRIPAERVSLVIGEVVDSLGRGSGHAWPEYQSPSGVWYVLESTTSPKGWVPVAMVSSQYVPHVVLNSGTYQCDDLELCQTVTKLSISCGCQDTIRKIASRFSA